MNVRLTNLEYYYRGQRQNIKFGDRTLISGKNGSGKSTVPNALGWLLNGYDFADDVLNNNLFDNSIPNSPEAPKSTYTKGKFIIDGTTDLTLEKRAKQVYVRQRGKTEYKRSNDVYEYFVNDLPVSATEYSELVESTFGKGEKLKLMLNTSYWEMLDERTLRRHFLTLVGEIDDTQFKNADYTPLFPLLHQSQPDGKIKDVAPEEIKTLFNNRIRDLEKEEKETEVLIKDRMANLIDISQVEEAEKRIAMLKEERESIDAHLLGLGKVNEEYVALRKAEEDKILESENAYRRLKLKYEDEQRDRLRDAQRKLDDALANNRRLDSDEARLKRDIENCENNIKRYELLREEKLKEMEQIDLRKFDGNCPHCGASLVGANRADAIARFKEKQSTDKQLCLTQGQKIRKDLDYEKERKSTLEADLANLKRIDTKPLREELAKVELQNQRAYINTQEAGDMLAEIEMLKANRTEMQPNPDIEKGQIRKGEIDSELSELYKIVGKRDERAKQEGEIATMEAKLKQSADAKCKNEQMRDLITEYIKEQSTIIKERANRLFDRVEIIMEEENKSGNLVPCCKLKINGVISTANTASRTRIGFEVSRAFQRYYDKVLPLFLDRAESLNKANIPNPDGQLMLMFVTEDDFKVEAYNNEDLAKQREAEIHRVAEMRNRTI